MGQLIPRFSITDTNNYFHYKPTKIYTHQYPLLYANECTKSPYFMLDHLGNCTIDKLNMNHYNYYDRKQLVTNYGSSMIEIYFEKDTQISLINNLAKKIIHKLGMKQCSVIGKIMLIKYGANDSSGQFCMENFSKDDFNAIQMLLGDQ